MADEVKKEEEETSTFGAFDNKYVRGGIAAVIAAYAAKQDPYVLEGFQEKIEEYEKADRARRDKFIETATASATKEIARNKLKRLERREAAEPEIKRAVALDMNPYLAGQAYQTGDLKTFLKQKAKNPTLDLNSLYKVEKAYRGKIPGFSTEDVLEALAGPTVKLNNLMDGVKAPKSQSFLRNFIRGGEEDTSAIDEINKNIDLQQPSQDSTTKAVDFSQVGLSKRGTEFLESVGQDTTASQSRAASDIASWVSGTLGLKSSRGAAVTTSNDGSFIFTSDNVANNKIAESITSKMLGEIERMVNNVNHPAYNDRRKAMEIVKDRYATYTKDGKQININAVNFNEKDKIMPDNWTPSTPTPDQINKKEIKEKQSAQDLIDILVGQITRIKKNETDTTTRNNKLKQAKKIAENRIIKLMNQNPPRATQADLDKVRSIDITS